MFGLSILIASQSLATSDRYSFAEEYSSIKHFVSELAKASGKRLMVSNTLENVKVTVFVDGRSAGELMHGLATLIDGQWVQSGCSLMLERTQSQFAAQRSFLAAEKAMELDRIDESLRLLALMSDQSQETLLKWEFDPDTLKEASPEFSKLLGDFSLYSIDQLRCWNLLGKNFTDGTDDFASQLTDGNRLIFYNVPSIGSLAPGALSPQNTYLAAIRYLPEGSVIQTQTAPFGAGLQQPSLLGFDLHLDDEVETSLANTKFLIYWSNWAALRDEAVNDTEIKVPSAAPDRNLTIPDMLKDIHDQSHIQVIAEATRDAHGRLFGARSVNDWTRGINRFQLSKGGYFRSESGFLFFRPRLFWKVENEEIPEDLLEPFIAKAHTQPLSINDYCSLAAKLSRTQMAPLVLRSLNRYNFNDYYNPLLGFDAEPLKRGIYTLRFIATLNPSLMNELFTDQGLSGDQLDAQQQEALKEAITEGFWQTSFTESEARTYLRGTNDLSHWSVRCEEIAGFKGEYNFVLSYNGSPAITTRLWAPSSKS